MEKQEYRKSVAEYADVQLMMEYREKVGMERGERRGLRLGKKQGLLLGLLQGEERGLQKGVQQGLLQGEERGLQKGEERGLQKGLQQARISIAKSALQQGMSIETVSRLTSLPVQEVTLLLKSL
jgi:predicted transposase YdaD